MVIVGTIAVGGQVAGYEHHVRRRGSCVQGADHLQQPGRCVGIGVAVGAALTWVSVIWAIIIDGMAVSSFLPHA